MSNRHASRRQAPPDGRRRRRWPITAAIAGGLVILVGTDILLSRPAPPAVSGPPRLAVNPMDIDLGRQPFERVVTASFVVTNTGGEPLRLDRAPPVEVALGC